ncbi:hypothetical protein VNO80_09337 [Phaseolus coccineus]|uniref:Uncharacterized protein n=1 Tax=Phaseolus coccineus TaxID=3886 RepID=A0AAN9NCD6_PHACN
MRSETWEKENPNMEREVKCRRRYDMLATDWFNVEPPLTPPTFSLFAFCFSPCFQFFIYSQFKVVKIVKRDSSFRVRDSVFLDHHVVSGVPLAYFLQRSKHA